MLTPDQVKPLLRHPDRYVREHATEYLHDGWCPDPDILPTLLDLHPPGRDTEAAVRVFSRAERFTVTEETLGRLIDAMRRTPDANLRGHLARVVRNAPPELA